MPARAFYAAMVLIGREMCALTCNDHNPFVRFARHHAVTGHHITGWADARRIAQPLEAT